MDLPNCVKLPVQLQHMNRSLPIMLGKYECYVLFEYATMDVHCDSRTMADKVILNNNIIDASEGFYHWVLIRNQDNTNSIIAFIRVYTGEYMCSTHNTLLLLIYKYHDFDPMFSEKICVYLAGEMAITKNQRGEKIFLFNMYATSMNNKDLIKNNLGGDNKFQLSKRLFDYHVERCAPELCRQKLNFNAIQFIETKEKINNTIDNLIFWFKRGVRFAVSNKPFKQFDKLPMRLIDGIHYNSSTDLYVDSEIKLKKITDLYKDIIREEIPRDWTWEFVDMASLDVETVAIGSGGFGQVYVSNDKEFAYKIAHNVSVEKNNEIIGELIIYKELIERSYYLRDNLLKIIKVIKHGDLVVGIVTEYCEDEFISYFNRVNTPSKINLFVDLCRIYHAIHDIGYVYFDIKPQNIMICNGIPKLIDTGSIRTIDVPISVSFGYQAPEISPRFNNSLPKTDVKVSNKSDIFAFGVMMLTTLFEVRDMFGKIIHNKIFGYYKSDQIMVNNRSGIFNPARKELLRLKVEGLNKMYLADTIFKCLETNPDDRPTFLELIEMLSNPIIYNTSVVSGGYYEKYIKYKTKYLNLKNTKK